MSTCIHLVVWNCGQRLWSKARLKHVSSGPAWGLLAWGSSPVWGLLVQGSSPLWHIYVWHTASRAWRGAGSDEAGRPGQ
eukprot:scaffold22893_cov45-Phaeocystis_antarctica.AAC.1